MEIGKRKDQKMGSSMVDLNDMMVFLNVVEHGSFTKAAEKLGVPKSNVSRKIARLEEALNAVLMARTTRSLNLTEVGQRYYQHCRQIKLEIDNAENDIKGIDITSAKIKVACSIAIGQELLSYHLAQFKLLHPAIDISITLLDRSIDIFREDFDLVLAIENVPTRTVDLPNSLKRCVLFSYCYHLYARQEYIESKPVLKAGELTMASLGALALLSLERTRTSSDNIPVNSAVDSNDAFMVKTMAEQGLGVALLPEYFIEPEFSELSKVFPQYCTEKETLVATYLDNKPVTPAISRLVDYLSQALSV
jgi:LysR family transcriptional regulator AphB